MHITDVLIHVDEVLATTQCGHLEEELRKVKGVIAPRFNRETPHLLLVSYDPGATHSHDLLKIVQTCGYHAQLVGM